MRSGHHAAAGAVGFCGAACPPADTGDLARPRPALFLGYARDGKVDPPALTEDGFLPTGDLLMTHESSHYDPA